MKNPVRSVAALCNRQNLVQLASERKKTNTVRWFFPLYWNMAENSNCENGIFGKQASRLHFALLLISVFPFNVPEFS